MADSFVASLSHYQSSMVFNPWKDVDPEHDQSVQGPQIRRRQLCHYLQERIGIADTLLCAEAIGYQGGHFSGIPMTSERLLLGGLEHKNLFPEMVFRDLSPQRTSRTDIKSHAVQQLGFTEPTATIVWGFLADHQVDTRRMILWNAFPWHPYHPAKGLLSNRTPDDAELMVGHQFLLQLLKLGQFKQVVAIGEKSTLQLQQLGIAAVKVRHPANGGAGKFRAQMSDLLQN
ncbi:Uracil DNA glycosylase superfamily [Desulfuromusa kysingii]|uniref:Uracil DNA glycosylase superfamily n=1 Tax=Desulfuromusa kysingii TaxID=37625 RepID=A0A1H3W6B5_9BACT|nr:uracil-DNA glycosylase [Desulfuromusa kysingii]SDZ81964.1 Uracil DNA glycosylase superfamily [Desulfuromusa kysingii]